MTHARGELPSLVAYVDGQKRHHAGGSLWDELERYDDGFGVGGAR